MLAIGGGERADDALGVDRRLIRRCGVKSPVQRDLVAEQGSGPLKVILLYL